MFSTVDAYPQLLSSYKIQDLQPSKLLPTPWKPSLRTCTDGVVSQPHTSQHRLPSIPEKRRQTTSSCCSDNRAPAAVREELMSCPKRAAGEVRPSVVIHYMPHRTFKTPILCTCIPDIKLPAPCPPPEHVLKRKSKSTGNLPLSQKISADNIPFKSVQNVPRTVYNVAARPPVRTYAGSGKPVPRFSASRNHCVTAKSLKKVLMKPVKALKTKLGVRRSATKEPYCRCEPIDWDFPVVTV